MTGSVNGQACGKTGEAADEAVVERIRRWIELDPDPATRDELVGLLDHDPEAAARAFDGRIAFGTAGLRGPLGPGPKAMNRLVVRQTTEGLMNWLDSGPTVVIAHDARHRSDHFAADVADVVAAAGGRAELIDGPVPTPVLAYAVLDRSADAGVMITASHNPATDNGYKLYLGDGIQLVSPADTEIAAEIDQVVERQMAATGTGRADKGTERGSGTADRVIRVDPDEAIERHRRIALDAVRGSHRDVNIVYTAMHGVGGRPLVDALTAAGFPEPLVVAEQFEPDPDFPTAAFPNPEEDGALDLAIDLARRTDGIDLILANDPDADRLAAVVVVPGTGDGGGDGDGDGDSDRSSWQPLTGDQVGALLADQVLSQRVRPGGRYVVASSIVSSQLITAQAADWSQRAEAEITSVRTLTGFKWVARPMVEMADTEYLFGYEEALGYCVGDAVRDKDGISAALVLAEIAAEAKAEGETLIDRLGRIMAVHGVHLTDQITVGFGDRSDDEARELTEAVLAIRPDELAGVAVSTISDLSHGGDLPPTRALVMELEDRSRVLIRPSGTEPKLKIYLEVIEPVNAGIDDLEPARSRARHRIDQLADAVKSATRSSR